MNGDVFASIFRECLRDVPDREYCRGVVEAIMELAETRYVAYRRGKVGYRLYLPPNDQPYVKIAVDYKRKRGLIVTLMGRGYTVFLIYKREGGRFRPIYAELVNKVIAAMTDPRRLDEALLQTPLSRIQDA